MRPRDTALRFRAAASLTAWSRSSPTSFWKRRGADDPLRSRGAPPFVPRREQGHPPCPPIHIPRSAVATIVSEPRIYPEYVPQPYYALFFKDPEGIKYEIVCTAPD